jgi:hypothetical protein
LEPLQVVQPLFREGPRRFQLGRGLSLRLPASWAVSTPDDSAAA